MGAFLGVCLLAALVRGATQKPATTGADGVAAVIEHLRVELVRAMQLCGVASLAEAKSDLLASQDYRRGRG